VSPADSLEYFLAGQHWLDALTPPLEEHLEQLAETVLLLLSRTAERRAAPSPAAQDPERQTDAASAVDDAQPPSPAAPAQGVATGPGRERQDRLLEILERHFEGVSPRCHLSPKIPPGKLRKVRDAYGGFVASDDDVLVLYDDSVFGGGREGFLFTMRGFGCKRTAEGPMSVRYSRLAPGQVRLERGKKLVVREKPVPTGPVPARTVETALKDILRLVRTEQARDPSSPPGANAKETRPPKGAACPGGPGPRAKPKAKKRGFGLCQKCREPLIGVVCPLCGATEWGVIAVFLTFGVALLGAGILWAPTIESGFWRAVVRWVGLPLGAIFSLGGLLQLSDARKTRSKVAKLHPKTRAASKPRETPPTARKPGPPEVPEQKGADESGGSNGR
jgi:hypothetical protein